MLCSSIKKGILALGVIGLCATSASAYTITYHNHSNYDQNKFMHYKKNHSYQPRVVYYSTNNPNITIMVKNPKHVSQKEIQRALKNYLRTDGFYAKRW